MSANTTSTASDHRAVGLTHAVTIFRISLTSLKEALESGHGVFLLPLVESSKTDNDSLIILKPTYKVAEVENQLMELEAKLEELERRLRLHGLWILTKRNESDHRHDEFLTELQDVASDICDLQDLKIAIALLDQRIPSTASLSTSLKTHTTPKHFFAALQWEWDPTWREFYARLPSSPNTYLYLTRWRHDPVAGDWGHYSVAQRADLTPEKASELLGSWEDWKWDSAWREWYVPIPEEESDEGEEVVMYASAWRMGVDEWELAN